MYMNRLRHRWSCRGCDFILHNNRLLTIAGRIQNRLLFSNETDIKATALRFYEMALHDKLRRIAIKRMTMLSNDWNR